MNTPTPIPAPVEDDRFLSELFSSPSLPEIHYHVNDFDLSLLDGGEGEDVGMTNIDDTNPPIVTPLPRPHRAPADYGASQEAGPSNDPRYLSQPPQFMSIRNRVPSDYGASQEAGPSNDPRYLA